MIFLRPARLDDAELLYRIRTDPATEVASFRPGPATMADHLEWLEDVLTMPAGRVALYVAERGGVPVGTGRLDRMDDGNAEVSITIAPEARGKGFAVPLLRALHGEAKRLGYARVVAEIKGSNVVSLRAFLSAGYASTEERVQLVVDT